MYDIWSWKSDLVWLIKTTQFCFFFSCFVFFFLIKTANCSCYSLLSPQTTTLIKLLLHRSSAGTFGSCHVDPAHMPAHMFRRLPSRWASIHFWWKSMTPQDQTVLAWPEVLFLKNCRLIRHSGPPPLAPRIQFSAIRYPRPGGSFSTLAALTRMSWALDTP